MAFLIRRQIITRVVKAAVLPGWRKMIVGVRNKPINRSDLAQLRQPFDDMFKMGSLQGNLLDDLFSL